MSHAGPYEEPVKSWKELQESDDNTVILQLCAGNHDALAIIVDRYGRLILSVALRIIKDRSEAEEVVQTVFLDIFRHPEQFDPRRGTLKMWLLQFAYSRSINQRCYLDRRKFYSRVDLNALELSDARTEPRGSWLTAETSHLIRQALRSLNARQKRAIELMYFQGLTIEEAAREAGETSSAIRHHYYRGLMKLRDALQISRREEKNSGKEAGSIGLEVPDAEPRPI